MSSSSLPEAASTANGGETTSSSSKDDQKPIVWLNNAGQAPLLPQVEQMGIQAILRPPWTPSPTSESSILDAIRENFASLIDCSDPSDIAITPNTAYAISLAATNIQRELLKRGSTGGRIILIQDQFCSAVYPWQQLRDESNGAIQLEIVPYPDIYDTGGWTPAIMKRLEDNDDVIAACLPPLHWSDGAIIDLEVIGQACRKKNVPLIVDATQAVGIMPVSVAKIQPIFLACSVHKWLRAPNGASIIYVSKEIQESWLPLTFHGRARRVETEDKAWDANQNEMGPDGYPELFVSDARKFDQGGKPNPILLPMLQTSLEFVVQTTGQDLRKAQEDLRHKIQPLLDWASKNGYRTSAGPHAWHIIGLRPEKHKHMTPRQLLDIASTLESQGFYIAVRCGGLRISPYVTTTDKEIQQFIEALAAADKVVMAQ